MRYNLSLPVISLVCGTAILTGCLQQTVKSAASTQPQMAQPTPAAAVHTIALPKQSNTPAHLPPRPSLASSVAPAEPVDLSPASPVAIDQISEQFVSYGSAVLGETRSYGVILPPGYNPQSSRRYPVIFLLHGGHGDQTDWLNPQKGDAIPTLKQLYQANKLPPSIVITPDGNDRRGSSPYWDPQYIDGPNGKVSTALGDELVKLVQSRYRTLTAPSYWAIGGLSSGGWGAVNVGLHHPNHFSILFSHSGYFVDKSGAVNSPMSYIKTLPRAIQQGFSIYLDTGASDQEYLQQAEAFHQELNRLQVKNVLQTFPGSHSWSYWRQHLTDSLSYVGKQFSEQAKTGI